MEYAVLLIAGICQGSFGMGYKRYAPLSWEAFWFIYSLFCLVVSTICTFIVCPNFLGILFGGEASSFIVPFICGMLWGLSTIAFSKSILMIGISLCFGINMGTSAVIGSIIPFFTSGDIHSSNSVIYLVCGIIITIIGIAIITKAGLMKDSKSGYTWIGIILAFISGLCSGIMNIGFDKASAIVEFTNNGVMVSALQWFPVLTGGMIASMIYCIIKLSRNRTWNTFANKGSIGRMGILFLTSIVWYTALILYGIASKLLGNTGNSIGWIIFNALALIVSNLWGLWSGEWKGHKKAKKVLFMGDAVLIIAWLIIINV